MKIKKSNSILKTAFQLEEYIPLKIKFDTTVEEYHPGCEFVKGDSSLLELLFGEISHQLFAITLVTCNEYKILNTALPLFDTIDGNICIDEEISETLTHFETSTFLTEIYSNGTIIRLSDKPIHCFYKNNEIIWGVDNDGDVCQFIVYMDNEVVEHLTNELQLQ